MEETKYTIGVDIGGTNTQYAVVDLYGNILYQNKFATRDYPDFYDYTNALASHIMSAICETDINGMVKGVGIGAPSVNTRTQCIDGATDLPWSGILPICEILAGMIDLPVVIDNDANAAAVGEMIYGCAKDMTDFIMLTMGTGMGSGVICDRKLIKGKSGYAGELGHVRFPFASDRLCGCGRYGCLQTICSSKGLITTAKRLMATTRTPSILRNIPSDKLTAKDIGEAVLSGDILAAEVMNFTEDALGRACAEFAAFSNPEAIILFGGVANPQEMNLNHIEEVMNQNILHLYKGRIKIMFSSLPGADSAILGSASLPWQKS